MTTLVKFSCALAVSVWLSACAHGAKQPTTAERVEQARGEFKDSESVLATVDEVDLENRVLVLRDDENRRFALLAGDDALGRAKPGDRLELVHQEVVAFALEDPNKPRPSEETKVEEFRERGTDSRVEVGRRITTTVQIVSVGPKGSAVQFRVPEGAVRTIAIDDAEHQREVENLRSGDSVRVTYTEKLAVVDTTRMP